MLSFSQFLLESVKLHKIMLGGKLHTGYKSTTQTDNHAVTTMFHRTKGLDRTTWAVNFFHHEPNQDDDELGNAFGKSSWEGTAKSNNVPPREAARLMGGAHAAGKKFMQQEEPHKKKTSLKFERDPEDPTKDKMIGNYRRIAKQISKSHYGRYQETEHGAQVHFNEN